MSSVVRGHDLPQAGNTPQLAYGQAHLITLVPTASGFVLLT